MSGPRSLHYDFPLGTCHELQMMSFLTTNTSSKSILNKGDVAHKRAKIDSWMGKKPLDITMVFGSPKLNPT